LAVASLANGCSSLASVVVEQDTMPPANVSANVSGALNCRNTTVTLKAGSSIQGVDYEWDAPNGNFLTSNPVVSVVNAGKYALIVTNSVNGCSKDTTVTVVSDKTPPVSIIIPPSGQPAALAHNTLSAQEVNNAAYLWGLSSANPNWLIVSGDNTPLVTYQAGDAGSSGSLSLRVTNNGNGCSAISQVTLTAISLKSAQIQATINDTIAKAFEIKAYPNPFTDKAFIVFAPLQSGHVTIDLYSNNGTLVKILFNGEVQGAQTYKVMVDGSSMAAGTYYFLIRTFNRVDVYTNQLILIK
jgi:hypothetical protein